MNHKHEMYFDRIRAVRIDSSNELQKKFIGVIIKEQLTISDISTMLGVNKHTVQGWLASENKKYYRRIRKTTLDNLIFRLGH